MTVGFGQRPNTLVTGGAGFIGSHVARNCCELDHNVVVLDDLSGGFPDQVPVGAHFIEGSVCNRRLVEQIFDEYKFDYVYHLAAYAAEGLSHFIRHFNYETNLLGSINLINEAVKSETKCFVFTSSIAVYGRGQLPMREDMVPRPEDPYGISKYAVELDLAAAHEQFGLPYIIVRPHNVYGPHQNFGDPYRNVLGIFMNQILQGRTLTVFGTGEQTRAFTHVDDVSAPIAASVHIPDAWNQVFNIGANKPYSVNEVARLIAKSFGTDARIEYLPARNEVLHAYAAHEKAERILGIRPKIGLESGIASMAAWVRSAGLRSSKPFGSIEVASNMPPVWASLMTTSSHNVI